jgi:hypothetical protein
VTPVDVHGTRGARCPVFWPDSIDATPQKDLGRCGIPRTGLSRLVPAPRGSGSWKWWNARWYTRLQHSAPQMGRRKVIQLARSQ